MGSFPVQAVDQGDRAEFVRKQLVSMKVILKIKFQACNIICSFKRLSIPYFHIDINMYSLQEVTPKRPVLMVISLAGIKVCCPQGQVRLYFKSLLIQSFLVLSKHKNEFYSCILRFHCSQNFDWEYARLTLETLLFVDNA